jgi:uncharacterized membrane protein
MLEIHAIRSIFPTTRESDDIDTKKISTGVNTMIAVIYLVFFIVAMIRAEKCSTKSNDSRAVHYLFAVVSPVMYVIVSYLVPGFCGK